MTIKQLNTIVEQGYSLKLISQAYTEIASAKLKKIRNLVEQNRYFLDDLSGVHQVVKKVAAKRKLLPIKNNRTISILITSNYHFYGNVNSNLIKFFLNAMRSHPTDQIVIGKTALEWLTSVSYSPSYTPLILKKDYPDLQELDMLVGKIKPYTQIIIFYSKLQSVIVQKPTFTDITQTEYLKNIESSQNEKEERTFIFEPELGKILDFFEHQVTNLLLEQTFLESELSRTASRLVSMDQAQTNADKYISEQKRVLASAKRTMENEKLIETFSALIAIVKQKDLNE